jgi:hypothetical protein
LLPELSAADNVSLLLLLAGTKRSEALRRSTHLLERLGLDGIGRKLPGELSGGRAHRVAVARALVTSIVESRSSYGRLAGIVGGVAVGVCLLLLLWGGANGLAGRDDRCAWLREDVRSLAWPGGIRPQLCGAANTGTPDH